MGYLDNMYTTMYSIKKLLIAVKNNVRKVGHSISRTMLKI